LSYATDKRMIIKQLKEVKSRAKNRVHTHEDYRVLVDTIIKLTEMVYEPLVQEEQMIELERRARKELESEDPFWNN